MGYARQHVVYKARTRSNGKAKNTKRSKVVRRKKK